MKSRGNGVTRIRDDRYGKEWRATSAKIKEEKGGLCYNCGTPGDIFNRINTHHISEKGRGGPDSLANTVLLCDRCHSGVHTDNRGMRAKEIKKAYRR